MEAVLRMPRQFVIRLRTSPLLLALAAAPMLVILILVAALIWISFQTGVVGTPKAIYTVKNYRRDSRRSVRPQSLLEYADFYSGYDFYRARLRAADRLVDRAHHHAG